MNRARFILGMILVAAAPCLAQSGPYDTIQRAYEPYMAKDDTLAFPMKFNSLATDPYTFWRGSKDLFFIWCKTHTPDWFADTKAILPNHGDLHLGNIGTYASADAWNKLAFGMVDFDDSANLPFQLELLQGLITLELTARQNNITLDESASNTLTKALFDTYRFAVNSRRNATSMLVDAEDPIALKVLKRSSLPYQQEIDEYIINGRFRRATFSEKGKLKEVLRPAMNRADEFAQAIAQALANEPDARERFRFVDAPSIRRAIKDIAQRTRLGSSGSQGLKKYFILLDNPLRGIDHDLILYLKQEIPSAAERSGAIERVSITPGQRVKQDMDRMTDPLPFINSWCEIGGESYWVTIKEPWSDELDPAAIKNVDELLHAARIWGTITGATHREQGRFETILPRLTPVLRDRIRKHAAAFIEQLDRDFTQFRADERVQKHLASIERELKDWEQGR